MAEQACEVQLSIGSQFENIELVQSVLEESLESLDFDDDSRYWIGIAVREAVANAIKHGNLEDPRVAVAVEVRIADGAFGGRALEIRVRDHGTGFDPGKVGDPRDPANLLKPAGRGIFYMKRFMDDIEYNFGPEGGTVVTLRKRLGTRG